MPRANAHGDLISGVGGATVSVWRLSDAQPTAIATNAGGADWLDENRAIYQHGSHLETFDVDTAEIVTIDEQGSYELAAGGGVYAAKFSDGVRISNRPGERFVGYGVGDVGPDGAVLLKTPDGLFNGRLIEDIQAHGGTSWSGLEGRRPVCSPDLPPVHVIDGPIYGFRRFVNFCCYLSDDGRFIVQHRDRPVGKVLAFTQKAFRPDLTVLSDGRLLVTYALQDDEPPTLVRRFLVSVSALTEDLTMPTPDPAPQPRFWLHPNLASADLLELVDRPELLANVGVLGLYIQQIIFDGPEQGSNTWEALQDAEVYRKLKEAGVLLNVEMGSVKPMDCAAKNALHNLEWMVGVVNEHGGEVTYVTQDEPLTAWIDDCSKHGVSIDQVADAVAAWMLRAIELGIPSVGWAEAWPHVGFATMQQFLDLLQARGVKPSHWHLDIDWVTAGSDTKVSTFIKAAAGLAESRGITLGLLVNSTVDPIPTDDQHFANLAALAQKLHTIQPDAPRVVVQSWARRIKDGPQTVPNNLGDHGLYASFSETRSVFGDPIPIEPPEPPEEADPMDYTLVDYVLRLKSTQPSSADGKVTGILPDGKVASVQPDGSFGTRASGTDGPWEQAYDRQNLLLYEPIPNKRYAVAYRVDA